MKWLISPYSENLSNYEVTDMSHMCYFLRFEIYIFKIKSQKLFIVGNHNRLTLLSLHHPLETTFLHITLF